MITIDWQHITTDDVVEAFGAAGIYIDRVEAAECMDILLQDAPCHRHTLGSALLQDIPLYIDHHQAHLIASYLVARPGI
jgi:hypothetical protein